VRKTLQGWELCPAVEGGVEALLTATPRKGHRDRSIFIDALNDALGARDTERLM